MKLQLRKDLEKVYVEENLAISKLNKIILDISNRYGIEINSLIQIINNRAEYLSFPAGIFNNILSPLENVVTYLKVRFRLSQSKIARIMNRDHTTIWTTVEKAKRKINFNEYMKFIESLAKSQTILIPISVINDRKLSILESACYFIKNKYNLSYHEIAEILGKNDRTIWTVVNRARKKLA